MISTLIVYFLRYPEKRQNFMTMLKAMNYVQIKN
nr:MAG TPA: hypothetical protein [Herelleviridae sp.]